MVKTSLINVALLKTPLHVIVIRMEIHLYASFFPQNYASILFFKIRILNRLQSLSIYNLVEVKIKLNLAWQLDCQDFSLKSHSSVLLISNRQLF